jgi:diaminohydroxyphosphoribosylaminopyrimidine deaminase/5-amino-6-(5-phosphoribosylamino)uracil reductase
VAGAFVDARLVDKVTFILAPIILGGPEAPTAIGGNGALSLESAMKMAEITVSQLGPDVEITGYPREP